MSVTCDRSNVFIGYSCFGLSTNKTDHHNIITEIFLKMKLLPPTIYKPNPQNSSNFQYKMSFYNCRKICRHDILFVEQLTTLCFCNLVRARQYVLMSQALTWYIIIMTNESFNIETKESYVHIYMVLRGIWIPI